jgi:hypothetical protein
MVCEGPWPSSPCPSERSPVHILITHFFQVYYNDVFYPTTYIKFFNCYNNYNNNIIIIIIIINALYIILSSKTRYWKEDKRKNISDGRMRKKTQAATRWP